MQKLTQQTTVDSPSLQPDGEEQVKEFPRGEIPSSDLVELEPIEAVNKFIGHRTASVNETVLSTIAVAEAVNAFRGDSSRSEQWLGNMVRIKALTKTDASVGLNEEKPSAPNLSKYRKIAKYEHIFRVPKIASLLSSGGFATLYECAKLFELLDDENPATAIDELHSMLMNHDGPASRDWLKKQGDARRPPKLAKEPATSPAAKVSPHEQPPAEVAEAKLSARESSEQSGRAGTHVAEKSEAINKRTSGQASIVAPVLTSVVESLEYAADAGEVLEQSTEPTGQEEDEHGHHNTDQPNVEGGDGDEIAAIVMNVAGTSMSTNDMAQIEKVIEDLGERAVVLLHGPLGQLLSSGVLLEQLGVSRCQAIYNVDDFIDVDLTNHLALAVYTRGNSTVSGRLSGPVTDTDPAILADHILDDVAGRKVLLFGSTKADGWESIEGSADQQAGSPMKALEIDVSDIRRG